LGSSLLTLILDEILKLGIKLTQSFDFSGSTVDPSIVQDWQTYGLPNDAASVENVLISTHAFESILILDSQNQSSVWIHGMEECKELAVLKPNPPNIYRTVENAIRLGNPVLLENVDETIDPVFDNLVQIKTYKQDGKLMIRFGKKSVEFDEFFKFYVVISYQILI
jgi:dynein heavy chain